MPELDYKFVIIGALFLALVLVKYLAGGRQLDRPVRRPRRFGFRGTRSPLRDPEAQKPDLQAVPPPDPEKEFFGEDGAD